MQLWEEDSRPLIESIESELADGRWFQQVAALWSQESNRANSSADLRTEHFHLIKMLGEKYSVIETHAQFKP